MSTLEEKNKSLVRRTELQEIILQTVATAGVIGIGLIAPNVVVALHKLGLIPHLRKREVVKSTLSRLRKKGLLIFVDGHYSLTETGKKILKHWQMTDYKIKQPKKWDKKWRVVIFDIPEKKRSVRTEIRRIFIKAGFYRLQDSVWVYPYNCENVIGLMKTDLGIGKDLLYMIVDQIENDRHLCLAFGLS
ncbi:MAG: CRISPR-associated endonuclease Cas2 [Candidatus Zambryskibacteria bacterium RIFCSPHIGHO2_02_FULL_43_14]|uniref:CRISPR-associated endonuclease Cas2 n=1 Tax=Candidatus Zambryskibacteria bacterium RIFCSPHIGHO2_02_FULL_43_14 TaxID=1802748 RepID=A0A1G2TFW1_9BACT|nr:MAG: CRISPR-associated endonuclease Cas2 [Candidatus Zambryskibacteria bacterium RIFCSPHIGHO2_01_FULL_43_60]OHA96177.1 MAG: CRISPR-associated endonuclease Cas2 [Candidatus Zambryskibacteria bacterium RIFCSPHIGHO2_02_FULL_43_14]OHB03828.1 MAG: CRISPR-associated endonuclease Cas2 [Candidatus Zambryskibacteria bacterium RIFCSPLOWO2_01_FULL_42_41]